MVSYLIYLTHGAAASRQYSSASTERLAEHSMCVDIQSSQTMVVSQTGELQWAEFGKSFTFPAIIYQSQGL